MLEKRLAGWEREGGRKEAFEGVGSVIHGKGRGDSDHGHSSGVMGSGWLLKF